MKKEDVKHAPKKAMTETAKHTNGTPEQKQEPVNDVVKRITDRAKPADQFEYDDADYAQSIYDKLPEGQYALKQGEKTVIQKL